MSRARGGLWKVVAFELVKDLLIGTARTSGCVENYLGSNIRFTFGWTGTAGGGWWYGMGNSVLTVSVQSLPGPDGSSS